MYSPIKVKQENDKNNLKCDTAEQAIDFLNQFNATEIISKIKIKINYNFDGFDNYDLDEIKERFINNAFVIFVSSDNKKKFFIYWKLKESQQIYSLKSYNENFVAKDKHLCKWIAKYLADSLNAGHSGIHKDAQVIDNEVQLHSLYDIRNYNLLLLAAESGNLNLIDTFINYGIESQLKLPNGEVTAQDLALKGQHWDVLLKLLQANLPFPSQINVNECSERLKSFIKKSEEFHKMIASNEKVKLEAILGQHPDLKYFYNLSNKSALKAALDLKLINMYEFLISKNFSFAPHEDTDLIYRQLELPDRKEIHEINKKHLDIPTESKIIILMSNTSIIHEGTETDQKFKAIHRAYNTLNSDHRLKIIMKIVSSSKLFRIIFDFNCDVTSRVNPILLPNVDGKIYYLPGRITIGAKQLLDRKTEDETLIKLISELCYYASKVPYESLHAGRIQQSIFDNNQPTELAAPKPLLTPLFSMNPKISGQIQKTFDETYHAYLNIIDPKLVRRDEGKRKEKVQQNFFEKYSFIFIILAIVFACLGIIFKPSIITQKPIKTDQIVTQKPIKIDQIVHKSCEDKISKAIDPQIAFLENQIEFNWKNLNQELREKFLSSNLNFQGEKIKFNQVFKLNPEAFNALTSEQIINVLNGKELRIGKELKSKNNFYILRKFIPEYATLIKFEYQYGHEYINNPQTREEHVKNRTKDKNFQDFYNDFLKKSYKKRSEIFEKVKENLYFRKLMYDITHEGFQFIIQSTNDIVSVITREKFLILSSEAGAGKTTTFEQLAMLIKSKYPTRWVMNIDLSKYGKLYDTNLNAKNFLENVLKLESIISNFEANIFEKLFQSDKLIIFWDGLDKISQARRKILFDVIKTIYNSTKNIQLISTESSISEQLKNEFEIMAWDFFPFDENEKHKFIKNVFISNNHLDKNIEENVKKVEKICKDLDYENRKIYIINNPLMLKIIAETYDSQKGNIYGIFEKLVETKIARWQENNENSIGLGYEFLFGGSLKSIFHKYAFWNEFHLFSGRTLGFKLRKLQIMQQEKLKYLSIEGVLSINEKNNFKFFHKTFSQFFVAQYFIENIFNSNSVDNDEAELRLELFFELSKSYGYQQQLITDFMMSYLQMRPQKSKKFNPIISRLLRTKFKNFFIRMLDTNHPKIYEFLFEFFKPDHDLLVDLLHVHEPETFYTAIFNPNYFALFVDPEEIKNLAQNCLNDRELLKFLTGVDQKGKILFGIHFYSLLNIQKSNTAFDKEIKSLKGSNFWEFFEKVNKDLTNFEQTELFVTAMSPKIYLFYDKLFSTADFVKYEKLWTIYENDLTESKMTNALGDALIFFIEAYPNGKESYLTFLLKKIEKILSKSQIFEMFLNKNILHEALWDQGSFQTLWNFYKRNTNKMEQKRILLQDDNDDKNFYFYYYFDEIKQKFSSFRYNYFNYDFTPFKIFHRTFTFTYFNNIDFVNEIYTNNFNKSEIQELFISSNDILYYMIGMPNQKGFEKIILYLDELFKIDKKLLKLYLEKKIEPTNLSIFEFVEEFKGLPYYDLDWFENLKALRKLYNEL